MIYKKQVQVVPKFISVPQPGRVKVVHKPVPMPVPSKPIYVKVPVVEKGEPHVKYLTKVIHEKQEHAEGYDCSAGYSNWYFGWSDVKKDYCCKLAQKGCPGTWHGSLHLHVHVEKGSGRGFVRPFWCARCGQGDWPDLQLQCRFLQLAAGLVGVEEEVVLRSPAAGLREVPLPRRQHQLGCGEEGLAPWSPFPMWLCR